MPRVLDRPRKSIRPRPPPGAAPAAPPSGAGAGPWRALSPAGRLALGGAFLVALLGLLAHAWHYRFLTDDGYISFRYARNLGAGHGLVFNPGMERVEGYSNFLWTVLLAGFARLGIAPEVMAHVLSLVATAALAGLVAWFTARHAAPEQAWIVAVPVVVLAATRSIAVWSTSGLETRWFEALLVAAALRLAVELEAERAGRDPGWRWSVWLFALATLTRPDGLLLALAAFAVSGLILLRSGRFEPRAFVLRHLPFVLLVGGHFVFRRIYYGDWLPNTYYAKVGGQTWWSSGARYLEAFALEYAMWLWIPLLVLGVWRWIRQGQSHVPLLFAALIVPHALYIAAIGGDHFEYRPLDLYLPFLFLTMAEGVRALATSRARTLAAVALLGLVLLGIWELPWQSRRQFPGVYRPGFPGQSLAEVTEARRWLDPARDPVYRLPILRALAERHRSDLRELSLHFVGVRQEEHRLFLASVAPEGLRLRELIAQGLLPRDVYVAMGCVGAIPYYSEVRTLDVLGLTDAHVAHSKFPVHAGGRSMAHDKKADWDYVRSRGVDLWAAEGVHTLCPVTSARMLGAVREAVTKHVDFYAADVGRGEYLVAYLPQGADHARRRMPRLEFRRVDQRAFVEDFLARGIAATRDSLRRAPGSAELRFDLAYLLFIDQQYHAARALYRELASVIPENLDLWENLALCEISLGNSTGARAALEQGIQRSFAQEDTARAERLRSGLARLQAPAPGAAPR